MSVLLNVINKTLSDNKNPDKKGLSLLEALLTITLITIAVSVVLPVSKIYIVSLREETIKKNLSDVREAIDKFKKERSHYPASIDQLIENRYLRRLEPEPFGNKWQYMPHTGPHEWKDFVVSVMTDKPYLASVKNISMKAQIHTGVKIRSGRNKDKDNDRNKDEDEDEDENESEGRNKDKNERDIADNLIGQESGAKFSDKIETYEIQIQDEIFDIRSSTEHTGINGVPYNLW